MDKYPWLLPVALVAAGIKCMLLYTGVIAFGFGTLGAYIGLSPLQTFLAIVAVLLAPGLWFGWRMWRNPTACPIPTSWFKRESEPEHARLLKAEPAPNTTVDRSPDELTLWFGAPIQPALSQVRVVDAAGSQLPIGDQQTNATNANVMTVGLPKLGPGTYTVIWRTLSAVNGQSVGGTFKFSIGEPLAVGSPASATH